MKKIKKEEKKEMSKKELAEWYYVNGEYYQWMTAYITNVEYVDQYGRLRRA